MSVLARSLPLVFDEFPDLWMVFVGSDAGYKGIPMKEYIIEKSAEHKDRLFFFDNQSHGKLFPIVKAAKMAILPSIWEAFGFVCVEAMALGRPVIASSGSGFEEIIEDNVSGFLIEPGNSEILARKIISCLKDEARLNRISKNAVERAEDFEVSKVALKLLDYYNKIIAEWKIKSGR
ncbi:glycosyltransferase family 4 protein [Thermodesulfobacteriota bacterium]